ncbi:MAG: hypothetical protein ABIK28_02815 [Planctomycetota bacterium]
MCIKTCFDDEVLTKDVSFSKDEVVALFLNMIAFDGDWDAHLDFLEQLDESRAWKMDQIPLVKELQRRDQALAIQSAIA